MFDLHMHTVFSDGKNTAEEMVLEAIRRGLETVGISDHSSGDPCGMKTEDIPALQLLFECSYEYGRHQGLGLLKGEIRPISEFIPAGLKIPQMGWNALKIVKASPLFRYTEDGEYVYFVHSYCAAGCGESLLATTEYGAELTACAGKDNVFGCQFHPEKSGEAGLKMLKAFCETEAVL